MHIKSNGMILGIVIGATITSAASFAASGGVQKLLEYNNIKITMNGQEITPTDGNGNYVEPFVIEGTTYLPVRAVANSLGLNVGWDDSTKTVALSTASDNANQPDAVIYEKNGIKITYNGTSNGSFFTSFNLLIENNSNIAITVQVRDESINGYMMDGIMSEDVQPGKKANAELSFLNSSLEENGISSIESVEFSFHIYTKEDWHTIDDSDIIKINP